MVDIDVLGGQLRNAQELTVDSDDHVSQHRLVESQARFEGDEHITVSLKLIEHEERLLSLAQCHRRIGELAQTPGIDVDDLGAGGLQLRLVLLDSGFQLGVANLRIEDENQFVLLRHALICLASRSESGCLKQTPRKGSGRGGRTRGPGPGR